MRKITMVPPILIALYSPLTMLAHNITEVQISDAYRALILSFVFALLTTAACSLLFRDIVKGALISIGVIGIIFSYGHIYRILKTITLLGFTVGRHRILLPTLLIALFIYVLWVQRSPSPKTNLLQFFLVTSIITSIIPTYTILHHGLHDARHVPPTTNEISTPHEISQDFPFPDVYYIMLDGYARQDVLMNYFNYDNTPFLSSLKEKGFYIADHSHANYAVTLMSIPSSINMMYMDEFIDSEAARSGYEEMALNELIQNSNVRKFLKPYGYEMVAFDTGYLVTEAKSAEHYLKPDTDVEWTNNAQLINRFEGMLLDSTIYRLLRDTFSNRTSLKEQIIYPEYEIHRTRIKFTLASLADFAEKTGNFFIFAHVVAPHPPFVFDEEGNSIVANTPFSMEDGNHYHGDIDDYRVLYPRQLAYINKLVMHTIETILDHSDTPPIIVIQADHGSGVSMDWENVQPDSLQERFPILNAYYFPDQDYTQLYPTITPVNTFRVIFNQFFDGDFEKLEDRSFFFNPPAFMDLYDVTDQLK